MTQAIWEQGYTQNRELSWLQFNARVLAEAEDAVGFLMPPIPKEELFPMVLAGGPLPRKTFSMGEARDKRYYLECRSLRP